MFRRIRKIKETRMNEARINEAMKYEDIVKNKEICALLKKGN